MKMSEAVKKAKLTALKGTHKWANDQLKDKISGLKKVTVSSDSKEGLEKGLDLAKKVATKSSIPDESEEDSDKPASPFEDLASDSESEDKDDIDLENCSEEELDAKIAELVALKEKMHGEG